MSERDVIEFIIVPPFNRRQEIYNAKERLLDYLKKRFPAYTFSIPGFAPVGDEVEFSVVPIMNYCGDDGKSYMCAQPKRWVMAEIADFCADFDKGGLKTCAA